jgi:hypothetical protein
VGDQAARADDRHRLPLRDEHAFRDQERAEVQEGDRIAVRGLDRDREPVRRDAAGEGDGASGRREHLAAERPGDVDPAMLARRERVVRREGESLQHRSRRGPRPRAGHRGHAERQEHHGGGGPDEAR